MSRRLARTFYGQPLIQRPIAEPPRNTEGRKWGGLGLYGQSRSLKITEFSRVHTSSYVFRNNYMYARVLHHLWDIARCMFENRRF